MQCNPDLVYWYIIYVGVICLVLMKYNCDQDWDIGKIPKKINGEWAGKRSERWKGNFPGIMLN